MQVLPVIQSPASLYLQELKQQKQIVALKLALLKQTPVIVAAKPSKLEQDLEAAKKQLAEEQAKFASAKGLSEKDRIALEEKRREVERLIDEKAQEVKRFQEANANAKKYQDELLKVQKALTAKETELKNAQIKAEQMKSQLEKQEKSMEEMIPILKMVNDLNTQRDELKKLSDQLNEKYKKELGEKDALLIQKDQELLAKVKQLQEIEAQKTNLLQQRAKLEEDEAILKKLLSADEDMIANQQKYINDLQTEIGELKQDLEFQEQHQAQLNQWGKEQEAEIVKLKQEMSALTTSESELKVELNAMKEERARLQLQLDNKAALEKTITSLQKKIQDKEREFQREREQEQQRYNERKAEMQTEIAQLQSELSQAVDFEKEAQNKIIDLEKQIDQLIQAAAADTTTIEKLRGDLDTLKAEKTTLEGKVQELTLKIEQDNIKMTALTEQLKQQQQNYATLMVQLNKELLEKQQLKDQLADATAKLEQATQLQAHLERRNKALEDKLKARDGEVELLNAQIEDLVEEKTQALERAAVLEAKVVTMQEQLAEEKAWGAKEHERRKEAETALENVALERIQIQAELNKHLKNYTDIRVCIQRLQDKLVTGKYATKETQDLMGYVQAALTECRGHVSTEKKGLFSYFFE